MNQILTTEKIYVTPQLKRKKKFYKFQFVLSILLLCLLISLYVYAEYDRAKSEEVGRLILSSATELQAIKPAPAKTEKSTNTSTQKKTSLSQEEYNVWTFILDETDEGNEVKPQNSQLEAAKEQNTSEETIEILDESNMIQRDTYYDSKGEPYHVICILSIPVLNSEYAILSRTTDELLKINPTRFDGLEKSPDPNEVGNLCIVGHNYRDTRFFSKVPTMEVGDIIIVTDNYRRAVTYVMYDKYSVEPTDISCLDQNTEGRREVTLITCNYDGSERVISKFREQK